MNPFMDAFADELVKVARGKLRAVGRFAMEHPLLAFGGLTVIPATVAAAASARSKGLHGGERGRFLHATPGRASPAAYANYHRFFEHPSKGRRKRFSKKYKPKAFGSPS